MDDDRVSRAARRAGHARGLALGPRWSAAALLLAALLPAAPAAAAQELPDSLQTAREAPADTAPLDTAPADTAPLDTAPADTADVEAEGRLLPESYGISGLVVDETRTTIGRDFYDVFYEAWSAPEGSVNYTVVVEEQPVPSLGTRIIVRINDEVAFDTRLQPRYELIREAALAAVVYARRALANAAPLSRGI